MKCMRQTIRLKKMGSHGRVLRVDDLMDPEEQEENKSVEEDDGDEDEDEDEEGHDTDSEDESESHSERGGGEECHCISSLSTTALLYHLLSSSLPSHPVTGAQFCTIFQEYNRDAYNHYRDQYQYQYQYQYDEYRNYDGSVNVNDVIQSKKKFQALKFILLPTLVWECGDKKNVNDEKTDTDTDTDIHIRDKCTANENHITIYYTDFGSGEIHGDPVNHGNHAINAKEKKEKKSAAQLISSYESVHTVFKRYSDHYQIYYHTHGNDTPKKARIHHCMVGEQLIKEEKQRLMQHGPPKPTPCPVNALFIHMKASDHSNRHVNSNDHDGSIVHQWLPSCVTSKVIDSIFNQNQTNNNNKNDNITTDTYKILQYLPPSTQSHTHTHIPLTLTFNSFESIKKQLHLQCYGGNVVSQTLIRHIADIIHYMILHMNIILRHEERMKCDAEREMKRKIMNDVKEKQTQDKKESSQAHGDPMLSADRNDDEGETTDQNVNESRSTPYIGYMRLELLLSREEHELSLQYATDMMIVYKDTRDDGGFESFKRDYRLQQQHSHPSHHGSRHRSASYEHEYQSENECNSYRCFTCDCILDHQYIMKLSSSIQKALQYQEHPFSASTTIVPCDCHTPSISSPTHSDRSTATPAAASEKKVSSSVNKSITVWKMSADAIAKLQAKRGIRKDKIKSGGDEDDDKVRRPLTALQRAAQLHSTASLTQLLNSKAKLSDEVKQLIGWKISINQRAANNQYHYLNRSSSVPHHTHILPPNSTAPPSSAASLLRSSSTASAPMSSNKNTNHKDKQAGVGVGAGRGGRPPTAAALSTAASRASTLSANRTARLWAQQQLRVKHHEKVVMNRLISKKSQNQNGKNKSNDSLKSSPPTSTMTGRTVL